MRRFSTIQAGHFRYIHYRDAREELYDCTADPHEWTNQAANADFATALKELRAAVPPLSEMTKSMPTVRGAKDE